MSFNNFLSLFKLSFMDLAKNPLVAVPSVMLWIFLVAFSYASVKINHTLSNSLTITIWLIFFSLLSLIAMSFLFSSLIGLSKDAINKKSRISNLFYYGKKFWFKNFLIIIVILASYNFIRLISHYTALAIGKSLALSVPVAQFLFFIIFFAGICSFLIFFSFSSFALVLKDLTLKKSISTSFRKVALNYPYVLTITILFFAIDTLLGYTSNLVYESVSALLILPYLSLLLTRLFQSK